MAERSGDLSLQEASVALHVALGKYTWHAKAEGTCKDATEFRAWVVSQENLHMYRAGATSPNTVYRQGISATQALPELLADYI